MYVGRFAPSPTGPLHLGSLVAAMASWLDARAHRGAWLLRIEDLDRERSVTGADKLILHQLEALGMHWDQVPVWQSRRHSLYARAFDRLLQEDRVYGCACTRREIRAAHAREGGRPLAYRCDCRWGLPPGRAARSWRFRTDPGIENFFDRWHGPQQQDVAHELGDFVLRRAEGLWAYQLAVVVDDAAQGVTDIVRGQDLLPATGGQRQLARRLGLPLPTTLHVPLVRDESGRKLSKQNHAPALDDTHALDNLNRAWGVLGFAPIAGVGDLPGFWNRALERWSQRFKIYSAK